MKSLCRFLARIIRSPQLQFKTNIRPRFCSFGIDFAVVFTILPANFAMKYTTISAASIASVLVAQINLMQAADWPQYRGPNHDGISTDKTGLNWPANGPKVLWKVPTAPGFSSFAVGEGKAFTQVVRDIGGAPKEICLALDAATGKELWVAEMGPGVFDKGGDSGAPDNKGGNGPRSTPAVSDGKVYLFTQDLVLLCLDAKTGKTIWAKDLTKEHAGRNIKPWRNAASVVIDGDLIFLAGGGPGESLLGIDKATGKTVWKSQDEIITHSSPVVATIHGVRQVIFHVKSGLLSVAAKDGKELWRYPFEFKTAVAVTPVVGGDIVFCSIGYGIGGGACKISKSGDKFTATELWKIPGDKQVASLWSTPVFKDGYLYGMISFKEFAKGPLKCVELATGQIKWQQPGFGAGQVILVGDKLVALSDDGQLVLVEARSDAYKELGRVKAIGGKCWSTPAYSDGRVYVRSTTEGACLDLAGK
jgi:outer membrane protein assembly factor BamB